MKKKNPPSLNVLQEQVNIDKKVIESGKVIIHKKVHEENKDVEVPVSHEEVEIRKVAVNKYITEPPDVRYEGNTTIIPVIKEVAVIEKKFVQRIYATVVRALVESQKAAGDQVLKFSMGDINWLGQTFTREKLGSLAQAYVCLFPTYDVITDVEQRKLRKEKRQKLADNAGRKRTQESQQQHQPELEICFAITAAALGLD